MEYWEELKEVELPEIESKVTLISPYMKIWIFPSKEVVKNITLGTKLELFSDYLNEPQNIDVNWQVLIGLKVNDWLNVDLQTTLLYDNDIMIEDSDGNIGPRVQFRELLMLSVGYTF